MPFLRDRRVARERGVAADAARAAAPALPVEEAQQRSADRAEPRPYRPDLEDAYSRCYFSELVERCSRLIVIPDESQLGVATSPGGVYTPTQGTSELTVNFPQEGWIVGLRTEAKGDNTHPARSSLMIRITTQGQASALTTDGQGPAFINLNLLSSSQVLGMTTSPLVRRVERNDRLKIKWANGSLSNAFTPAGAFVFVSCEELEAMGWPRDRPPPAVGTTLPAYTRAIILPTLPSPSGQAPPSAPLTANQISNGSVTELQHEGLLVGFRCDTVTDDFANQRKNLAVQIEAFKERSALISDGFALAYTLASIACSGNEQYLNLARRVHIRDKLTTTFKNVGAATLAANGVWFLRADQDLARRNLIEG